MPLLKFDVMKGRTDDEIRSLLDVAHEAMVEVFGVPESDRYQSLTQHNPGELILRDTGLGYTRSNRVVLLTVISRPRTKAQKQAFYTLLARRLKDECGLSPDDLMVSLVENGDEDWSFGRGKAEFVTGELK
ncbi:tautomerase family protein [Klebsiella michiganensis]|uniref:tautomerase family protein n=1 Tax=Klebsiella michiganensis TaxID=1134687 RepID=UPI00254C9102|nr:tautomerase family protein [Klebsiella michiganensis]MDK9838548.1 tautomerase family protein [Klebsiella michiganensis]